MMFDPFSNRDHIDAAAELLFERGYADALETTGVGPGERVQRQVDIEGNAVEADPPADRDADIP